MSLPPLSLSANSVSLSTNSIESALQKSQALNAADGANMPAKVSHASSVQTLQTLIHELKITQTTTLNVKVEGTGIVPAQLLTSLSSSGSSKTQIQSNMQATSAPASHPAAALHWSKIQVTQTLSLLLTYTNDTYISSSEARQLSTIGGMLTITVSPNGHLAITPQSLSLNIMQAIANPNAHQAMPKNSNNAPASSSNSAILSNITPAQLISSKSISSHATSNHALNTPPNNPLINFFNTNNLKMQPPFIVGLSKLDTALNTQSMPLSAKYPHTTLNHFYNNLTKLMHELKSLSPAISQQLLPNKLINTLTTTVNSNPLKLPNSLTPSSMQTNIGNKLTPQSQTPHTLYSRLVELTQKHIENGNSQAIAVLQQGLNLSQKMAGSSQFSMSVHSNNPEDLFSALFEGLLPKHGATSNHIQEARQAIARWLSQELSSHINRMASTQIQSHFYNLEQPNEWSQQIDIPLRWGEEFGNVQLRIAQKKEETHNAANERKSPQADNAWEIAMDFELPQYTNDNQNSQAHQTMTAHLKLQQSSLSVEFWSEDKILNQTIEARLGTLAKQLKDSGLTITRMLCHRGMAPAKTKTLQQTIIDIKT